MSKRILFATTNEGKMKEIRMILADIGCEVISLKDIDLEVDIAEDGETFEENAIIKAEKIMEQTNEIVLADDSGLEIDYLNGEPGVYSARYLGEDTPYTEKNKFILKRLEKSKDKERGARFVCAIACAIPGKEVMTTRGVMEGEIAEEASGENGFGYDPIFFLPEFNCTSAQLTAEQKNVISHRGKALEAMKRKLEVIL